MLFNTKILIKFTICMYVQFCAVLTSATERVSSDTKIFKGDSAVGHRYLKHMALVSYGKSICGGAILTPKVILTAAHCITKDGSKPLFISKAKVCAGTPLYACTRTTPMVQIRKVRDVIVHENYTNASHGKDIAILILSQALVEDGNTVKRISLPASRAPIGTTCTIIGWGRVKCLDTEPEHPKEAQYTTLTRMPANDCKQVGFIKTGQLCFAAKNKRSLPCKGDSGGPLICNGKAAGVTSIVLNYPVPGSPVIYTDIFYYRKWISNIINRRSYNLRSVTACVSAASFYITILSALLLIAL